MHGFVIPRSSSAAPPPGPVLGAVFLLLAAGPAALPAQEKAVPGQDTAGWDVSEPRGEVRRIEFRTREGTWMSVDVAPDGEWLVFDLMGHLYRLPADGGEARALTQESGLAWNFHPRVSPDGGHIAFVSDRGGQENLWIMEADGSDPRPVFVDPKVQVRTPAWTADGRYVVVRRRSIEEDSEDEAGLWMYHRDGGDGVKLVSEEEVSGAGWPSVSPDGEFVYFHQVTGGEPLNGDYQLRRYEFETGRIVDLTAGDGSGPAAGRVSSGGAYAPETSPDGRRLAFARRIMDGTISRRGHELGPRTALWVRDLETGAERKVMDPISVTVASGGAMRRLPGYAWTPDGKAVVVAQGGKLRRVDVATGEVETVPFEARVRRALSEQARNTFRITDGPFRPRFLRWHTASPDGSRLAFQAVGQVWTVDLPEGTPRRLTPASFDYTEYAPAWSPDGDRLAFTAMDSAGRGHVWTVSADGGEPRRVTREKAFYTHPTWSPDGRELVVTRGGGATARERTVTHNPFFHLIRLPASGGEGERVATVAPPTGTSPAAYARRSIVQASWGPEGRIYWPEPRERSEGSGDEDRVTALVSARPDGTDRRVHMTFPHADEVVPSPNGEWVAFQEGDNVYLAPFPSMGTGKEPVHLERRDGKLPVTALSREGGMFPRWRDASTVEFGSGPRHFTYGVRTERTDTTVVEFTVEADRGRGTLALTGGRVLTMRDGEVIEDGTVVVEDGRIRCVGERGECDPSDADRVVDAAGKTILPGLVDMHAHHYREHRGHRPRRDYEVAIYLAYGVTTNLDNSMWSQNVFPTAERIRAGRVVGPRTFSTGDPLYYGDGARHNRITGYQDARHEVRRLKSWGAVSVKQYSYPRRDVRQWVIDAARRERLSVTGHWNPGVILDGHTGWEHPMDWLPLYSDFTTLYGWANAVYSPTLVVGGPGPSNIERFFQAGDVWKDSKQRRWMPWRMLTFLRRRALRPETDYTSPFLVQGVADLMEAGGHAAVGGHGEHHALSPHWDIWMYAEVLGPMQALEIVTREGAWFLGAQEDIGTLEAGKLADLLVLRSDPLEDIRNTLDLEYVMKGGRLYEAESLDEVWPRPRPFGEKYWIDREALIEDARPVRPDTARRQ